jgi:D-alanyl-D-alanine-carboxypeptidase/D-alanyl-D-alanine-endopeptidase
MLRRGFLLLGARAIAFAQTERGGGRVVGTIDPEGRTKVEVVGDVHEDSLFEIGSITKVFTALVLSDMVERGELRLSDRVSELVPAKTGAITLEHLATHMSGLPRLPNNMAPANIADPYASYTVERLYEFLRTYELPRAPGAKWEYSNLGFGLLGHAVARRAEKDYETMVRLRVCNPLDMIDTRIDIRAGVPAHVPDLLVKGHSMQGLPVGYWNFTEAMAGAGAFRSNVRDMLEFLAAVLGRKRSGLAPAMAAMLRTRAETGIPGFGQYLGWNSSTNDGREIVWKDGGTLGFSSFIGFDPKRRTGAVVLSSVAGGVAVETGMKILRAAQ